MRTKMLLRSVRISFGRQSFGHRRGASVVARFVGLGFLLVIGGCSIAGSWKIVSLDPPGAPFPLETLTLDSKHNYTATRSMDGRKQTDTGKYKWNGLSLEVMHPGHQPRKYGARLRLDGKLTMTAKHGDAKVVATLERVKPL